MAKTIINIEELPLVNRRVYDLVVNKCNGNVKLFADSIGVSQQVLDRIFRIDNRSKKYPSVSDSIKNGIYFRYNINEVWLLTGKGNPLNEQGQQHHSNSSYTGIFNEPIQTNIGGYGNHQIIDRKTPNGIKRESEKETTKLKEENILLKLKVEMLNKSLEDKERIIEDKERMIQIFEKIIGKHVT